MKIAKNKEGGFTPFCSKRRENNQNNRARGFSPFCSQIRENNKNQARGSLLSGLKLVKIA